MKRIPEEQFWLKHNVPSEHNRNREKNWDAETRTWTHPEVFEPERPSVKPHKGRISNWQFLYAPLTEGLLSDTEQFTGEFAIGIFVDHPQFATKRGHTSLIVKKEQMADGSIEIETLNSRYTLIATPKTCDKAVKLSDLV